jgi:hypothetical protein
MTPWSANFNRRSCSVFALIQIPPRWFLGRRFLWSPFCSALLLREAGARRLRNRNPVMNIAYYLLADGQPGGKASRPVAVRLSRSRVHPETASRRYLNL